ncbi:hypothetical protein TNCV_4879191 [Trichonephila clavipes]|nr:hypothetical protein TNCV_4879191 [Trichonephila clavipes]
MAHEAYYFYLLRFWRNKNFSLRLPSLQTTPIHSPSNLSDGPGFGFVSLPRSDKPDSIPAFTPNKTGSIRRHSDLRVIRHVVISSVIHQQPGAIS